MILVTGATGFLGSELVKQLVEAGKTVRALKRPSSQIPAILLDKKIDWVDADILDYFALEKSLEGVRQVYHCAALVSFAREMKKKQLRINKEGTQHLVNLCLDNQIDKFLHVSSVAALGSTKDGSAITEKNNWEFDGSQSGYSISKYESEMEVWRAIAEGLNAVIVNPSIILGKNAGKKGSSMLFNTVQKGLPFYTSGTNGYVDVEDVARAMILLMESNISEERFILNAENWSTRELFAEAAEVFKKPQPRFNVKPWLMKLGVKGAEILSMLNGKNYALTRDTAASAFKKTSYSSAKFLGYFPHFRFKPVKVSIKEVCDSLKP